jgi:ParB/RepB/Spo0J family partition protein
MTMTKPNRRTLLFDGFLRTAHPEEKPAISTIADPDSEAIGLHRRGALLDRLVGSHETQVKRGFYSLLESAGISHQTADDELEDPAFRVLRVDLSTIGPNSYLPPVRFGPEVMERVVRSIQVNGLLEPLLVMPAPEEMRQGGERYWIISGEHLRQAAVEAGLRQVPVIVKQVSLRGSLQMFLAQSMHNYEFWPLDHARVFQVLTEDMGMTPERLAESIGAVAEEVITELGFLKLDERIQESLVEGRISADQAKVLLEAEDDDIRYQLWRYAVQYRPRALRMRQKLQELAA